MYNDVVEWLEVVADKQPNWMWLGLENIDDVEVWEIN